MASEVTCLMQGRPCNDCLFFAARSWAMPCCNDAPSAVACLSPEANSIYDPRRFEKLITFNLLVEKQLVVQLRMAMFVIDCCAFLTVILYIALKQNTIHVTSFPRPHRPNFSRS